MKNETKLITRTQYMKNSSELFDKYYGQFVTDRTVEFVKTSIGVKLLKTSEDKSFNDIIKHSSGSLGGWVWDYTPINLELARELGEVSERGLGSKSTHTCVGKTAARLMLSARAGIPAART